MLTQGTMPGHGFVDLIVAAATGICRVHDVSAKECGAADEAATLGLLAIIGAGVFGVLAALAGSSRR